MMPKTDCVEWGMNIRQVIYEKIKIDSSLYRLIVVWRNCSSKLLGETKDISLGMLYFKIEGLVQLQNF